MSETATCSGAPVPEIRVRCDFCSNALPFRPATWNARTCDRCKAAQAPDQGAMEWGAYRKAVRAWLRTQGRLAPLSGAAGRTPGRPFTPSKSVHAGTSPRRKARRP
jgi:hypothetical protein